MKFYSEKEIAEIKSVIANGENFWKASQKLSKQMKRTQMSVYQKICLMAKGVEGKRKPRKDTPGIVLKKGFTFNFKPSRAEMHDDYVKLYF